MELVKNQATSFNAAHISTTLPDETATKDEVASESETLAERNITSHS